MKPSGNPAWAVADAYLFDIDGTLLNVRDGTHYRAFQKAMRQVYGVETTIDGVPVHGSTDVAILRAVARRAGITDDVFEAGLEQTVALMCAEVCAQAAGIEAEVCPSIRELLQEFHAGGKLLGVVSGNLEAIGWLKLSVAGLCSLFRFGCFSDRLEQRELIFLEALHEVRRRLGPAAIVCAVGDTPSDIRAAQTVGMPLIALATGMYGIGELRSLRPDACFSSCVELLSELHAVL